MNYYELRKAVSKFIPRSSGLINEKRHQGAVKEKGRKSGYQEYKLNQNEYVKQERLLNTEEVNSFVEISCRAAACPMPLNIDVWDGLLCPFGCKYCFANSFRASLYTAFFDNSKTMGMRHCNPTKYKTEMDKLLLFRGKNPHDVKNDVAKAIAMEVPIRFGIRFEDFLDEEKEAGISLELLNYLADHAYPTMINTKSALVGTDKYVKALSRNKGKAAVHVTLISSNNNFLKDMEPGAPSYKERLGAMKNLVQAGVRVVARVEPYLVFVNDKEDDVRQYISDLSDIGVKHMTFDTYSYTAKNPGIRQQFKNIGIDWERLFVLGADSQAMGSLLLGEFIKLFRDAGISCSTFDLGNVPDNNQAVCCEVGDWFQGFNWGCTVMAAWFIKSKKGQPVSWNRFKNWVDKKGGFLSSALENEVHRLWNCSGSDAYSHSWARGMVAVGNDGDIIWKYDGSDFRLDIYQALLKEIL